MNTTLDTSVDTVRAPIRAVPARSPARTFGWLLQREYWEHRGGFLWAPIIACAIGVILATITLVIGAIKFAEQRRDPAIEADMHAELSKHADTIGAVGDGTLLGNVLLAAIVLAFVVFFYSLGSLYDDRRDRSALFWKSLPVSDLQTVLSKVAWALVLGPVLAIAAGLVLGAVMWGISFLIASIAGMPNTTALFTESHPFRIIANVLLALPVYAAWALPSVGWLMFCSAWARSKPILWAVLLPLLGCVMVTMVNILPMANIPLNDLWYVVAGRGLASVVPGSWLVRHGGGDTNGPEQMMNTIDLHNSWQAFASADLWIGVAVGAAFIAGAVYLRRWRELAD